MARSEVCLKKTRVPLLPDVIVTFLELSCSVNSTSAILSCATFAFSERYVFVILSTDGDTIAATGHVHDRQQTNTEKSMKTKGMIFSYYMFLLVHDTYTKMFNKPSLI